MKKYKPQELIDQFVQLAYNDGKSYSPRKLQMLVYYCEEYSIYSRGESITDDEIEVTSFGIAFSSLWDNLGTSEHSRYTRKKMIDGKIDPRVQATYDKISHLSTYLLVECIHYEKTPWSNAILGDKDVISRQSIRDFIKSEGEKLIYHDMWNKEKRDRK